MNDLYCEALIQKLVAAIDEMIQQQLSLIIQHPRFKELESLWRGLLHLNSCSQPSPATRIRILDMSWSELSDDLNLSSSFQSSVLYRLINQQELNTLGGHPFGLLVVDHYVSLNASDNTDHDEIYTLQLLSELGQASLCPVIMALSPNFLLTRDQEVWSNPQRVSHILASDDFSGWRRLRNLPSSRFLGLTLPQFLVRAPWHHYYQGIRFDEISTYSPVSHHLWGSSAFALAGNIVSEFNRIHWFGFLRVAHGGGAVVNDQQKNLVARVKLTDRLGEFFSEHGFIPMETCYLGQELAFFNNRSIYKPANKLNDQKITSMIQTTLIGCRFGHYLKVLIREHIGSYDSAEACERQLNAWLQEYTSNVDQGNDQILARYPLRHSKAEITGDKNLGIYTCVVYIQPQYQFDFIKTDIVLKTDASELVDIIL
ncbi:type VI secretion system contractile sheath domain-containing protein [Endozoicomonas arenosclerae]|uniref:type VI secretion system contractile sheath domain-containing protein n=1 Tax=Endozoicomonas arenosclerae TaxID=1633495 RepID=UPI0007817F8E|nr:type VI secretion system contractile sheath large subunit [Endozoicomonas arenosclerae]